MNRRMVCGVVVSAPVVLVAAWTAEAKGKGKGKKGEAAASQPVFLDAENAPKPEALKDKSWMALFNGKDLTGWKARNADRPLSWKVEDGILSNAVSPEHHGVDIVSEQKFKDFEVYYEYRIPKGSNSGLYLRGRYEIQILDDYARKPGTDSNGGLYSVVAPSKNVSRMPGEWQSVYAKIVGKKVTVVLNEVKVIDNAEASRPTGGELDRKENEPGPIMIQGDHGSIDLRYVYLHPIGGEKGAKGEKAGKAEKAEKSK